MYNYMVQRAQTNVIKVQNKRIKDLEMSKIETDERLARMEE